MNYRSRLWVLFSVAVFLMVALTVAVIVSVKAGAEPAGEQVPILNRISSSLDTDWSRIGDSGVSVMRVTVEGDEYTLFRTYGLHEFSLAVVKESQ